MSLALYYAPTTCALVSFVSLTEAQAEFEVRVILLSKKQQFTPDYLAINPLHKVPALAVDGRILTENIAIHLWLARKFPHAGLFPDDPFEQAQAVSLMAWCASGIHPHLSRINAWTRYSDCPGSEEAVPRLARAAVRDNMVVADARLKGRTYFLERLSAADTHFFWCWRRALQLKVPLEGLEHAAAHFARMNERDSVKKVLAFEAETIAATS